MVERRAHIGRSLTRRSLGADLSVSLLGGSWDLVSKVISTLIGVRSSYK